MPQQKLGKITIIFRNSKLCVLRKLLKDTKHDGISLVQKYSSQFSSSHARRKLFASRNSRMSADKHRSLLFSLNGACCLHNRIKTCYQQPLLFILLCYLFRFVNIHCSTWLPRSWSFVVMNHVPRFTIQSTSCAADLTSFLIHHLHKVIHHLKSYSVNT